MLQNNDLFWNKDIHLNNVMQMADIWRDYWLVAKLS